MGLHLFFDCRQTSNALCRHRGGVLVLLADQQGDVKVARCDEHDFNTCTGQCGQRTGGDAAAGDHLLTKEVDLAVAAGDQRGIGFGCGGQSFITAAKLS